MHADRRLIQPGRLPIGALLLVVAGLVVGCSGANHPERVAKTTTGAVRAKLSGIEQQRDDLVQFRARTPIDLIVESFAGDVVVIADPGIEVTTVQLVREAHHGYLRGFEPVQALEYLSWNARLDPGPGPVETLRIETNYSGPEPWYMRAHLRIETPRLDRVRVRTTRGLVSVRNNTGPVDIETNLGDVTIATRHPLRDAVRILVSEGSVDYRVPGGSTGELDLAVVDGSIQLRVTEGRLRFTDGPNDEQMVNAVLDDGRNPLLIRTTEGDIRIAVVEEPLSFGPWR